MKFSAKKGRRTARANLTVAVGSTLYFLVLLLALYVMDRQVYTAEKVEIIRNNFLEIFNLPDTINDEARRALYATPEDRRDTARQELQATMQAVVDGPTSLYRMWLSDENGRIIIEATNTAKPDRLNTWQNNLFIRRFNGRTSQNVTPVRTGSDQHVRALGHLVGVYTSPTNVPAITQLTHKYRIYAALLISGWILVWLALYYYLLRPVRNVTLHLDRSTDQPPALIRSPRGALEHGYNDLAASALLQSIEEILNRAARVAAPQTGRAAAIREALRLAGTGFGAQRLRAAFIPADEGATEIFEWSAAPSSGPAPPFEAVLPQCPPDSREPVLHPLEDQTGFTWQAPLATGCLQIDCRYESHRPNPALFQGYLLRACESLRAGFVAFQAYREQLFRERSEANISLSRNMGHDLTNIIATSKLELMGIRRVLQSLSDGQSLSEQRATILSQSTHGLLESTRFMQEMVNIYRSFSYVKRPAYERRQLAPLIEEFLVMFEPALSAHVAIHRDLPADLPAPIVEPRLLKLAIFNVLQNALDAVKRIDDNTTPGHLDIRLRYLPAEEIYEIIVRDNGPGIRDEAGTLLSPDQVVAIFDYGYTTKGATGEGLGLNWVKTIMTEFHDGGIRAENNADGGATITLHLRSMERKEARVAEAG